MAEKRSFYFGRWRVAFRFGRYRTGFVRVGSKWIGALPFVWFSVVRRSYK